MPRNCDMAGFREVDRQQFPLQDISSIVGLFKQQLESSYEPDLALLSIIVGAVENSLTWNRALSAQKETESFAEFKLPPVEYHIIEALYSKFHAIIKGAVDLSLYGLTKFATRELVKKVSDVIWNSLTRSYYKDRAHLQSLYSYLTGNKLDCFGVAFAVVAGCQVLGFRDVHLALSEDHAWVVFGEGGKETAEVTWHGKGNEDKRGQPVGPGIGSKSWLYVNGRPVICTRPMEVAALVSAINPSLSPTTEAMEIALLQQELLWLLYDLGHLSHYPMALGNLSDLEEVSPTPGRPPCSALFQEAVLSARTYYANQHVYPYTYQGGYFYRHKMYKQAFESWANASDVIRHYNYSRDDEEVYKEFLEIANELIPQVIRVVGSGHSARSLLKDPECFAHLLRFYDGICQWEEGSATPVLHIGWAKPLVNTISKFDAAVRARVDIICQGGAPENGGEGGGDSGGGTGNASGHLNNNNYRETDIVRSLESRVGSVGTSGGAHPSIAALTAACGEKILNRDYLLAGGGPPFASEGRESPGPSSDVPEPTSSVPSLPPTLPVVEELPLGPSEEGRPQVILHSQKMRGLKDLLLAEKLNTHAISLQLTAQSQVQVGRKVRASEHDSIDGFGIRNSYKRARRE